MAKRLKLSLEPYAGEAPIDVDENGYEIPKEVVSLREQLTRDVDRLWVERGELRNITAENLRQKAHRDDNKVENGHQGDQTEATAADAAPGSEAAGKSLEVVLAELRRGVFERLNNAKSEIDVTLDVVNLLISQAKASATPTDRIVLAPGILKTSYIPHPRATLKKQTNDLILNFGLKRRQLTTSSDNLIETAKSMQKIVDREKAFWDEGLRLRKQRWMMHAVSNAPPSQALTATARRVFVQYGFADVGSRFQESSHAEITRNADTDIQEDNPESFIQITLPHRQRTTLQVKILDSSGQAIATSTIESSMQSRSQSIRDKLQQAQRTIFDAEAFNDALAEARSNFAGSRIGDRDIQIRLDTNNNAINIALKDPRAKDSTDTGDGGLENHMASVILESMRLSLCKKHRTNVQRAVQKQIPNLHLSSQKHAAEPTSIPQPDILTTSINAYKYHVLQRQVQRAVTKWTSTLSGMHGVRVVTRFQSYEGEEASKGDVTHSTALLIEFEKSYVLRFLLKNTGGIVADLPSGRLQLTSVEDFLHLLQRESTLVLLEMLCEEARSLLTCMLPNQARSVQKLRTALQEGWTVDRVEESVQGIIPWNTGLGAQGADDDITWRSLIISTKRTESEVRFLFFVPKDKSQDLPGLATELLLAQKHVEQAVNTVCAIGFREKTRDVLYRLMYRANAQ
ncbi:hypothetical protein BZG36_01306 [Bifiguratus adelaidae]|uniref:Mediator of RNA polymerase II transcription subunit 17 n=1 Tax=Bifiguratus adelaidae TaxID=1938954 RepID=A0A261Y5M9_9FUNG|nr:hypothetical protein BZG36_01306 [Bifiguratus adelaidae]